MKRLLPSGGEQAFRILASLRWHYPDQVQRVNGSFGLCSLYLWASVHRAQAKLFHPLSLVHQAPL